LGYLAADSTTHPPPGPLPPNNVNSSLSFITGVIFDGTLSTFGAVVTKPKATYAAGAVINATFVGANPRNNLRLEETFAAIDQLVDGAWVQVRSDADWSLVYTWINTNDLFGFSEVTIQWESETTVAPGTYRSHYYGDHKDLDGVITAFEGISSSYTIT
jgi:neutral ceramidase